MASEIDICNLALGHLGDDATVSSIDPPEGSAQAEHCQRFYPMARDSLLEMHTWGFTTRRIVLAQLENKWPEWSYTYSVPNDMLNVLSVLAPDAPGDYSATLPNSEWGSRPQTYGAYTPQEFSLESDDSGNSILLTNQQNAVLRYTARVTDTTKYSPLFTDALAWLLASYLAGPVLKGDSGSAAAKSAYAVFKTIYSRATASDANQLRSTPAHNVSWMAGR